MLRRLAVSLIGLLAIASALAAVGGPMAEAANTPAITIRVKDMHCENCAAKIRRGLYSVAGVVNVKTHVKSHTAFVVPQQNRQPSPRAMWEAVEKAGFEVVQIAGPGWTITEKPQ